MLRSIWTYRGFISGSVKREFQTRYRNSLLGAAWMIINPLATILVYTVIFSKVMSSRQPGINTTFAYSIYLCAGVLTWGLFTDIVGRGQQVFIEYANLIKKISFPRICLPIIVVLNALLNFSIIYVLFTAFLIISGNFPGWSFLGMFPVLLIQIAFSIGLGMVLGVLNVFFRDIGHFFGLLLQFWFWFTPIVYSYTILPEKVRSLLILNPMAAPIIAYQNILVKGEWPNWQTLVPFGALSILLCVLGMHLFRRHAGEMADEL